MISYACPDTGACGYRAALGSVAQDNAAVEVRRVDRGEHFSHFGGSFFSGGVALAASDAPSWSAYVRK
jgi:hypothetical protein